MEEKINRDGKDRLFCFIFGRAENRAWTLDLYNAVNGTEYTNPDDVEITTMEDCVYMGMKNDVSFIIESDISLYEHQSSFNPNMPVRQLMYLGRQYDKYIKKTRQNIYGKKQMILPVPRLITFYNGIDDVPDRILKLSDSFPADSCAKKSDVEVTVHMHNIRPQYKSGLIDRCKPLGEYTWFVEKVRDNRKKMGIAAAVDNAIMAMPEDFIIRSFLEQHQREVRNMCLTEYNEAETMQMFKEEGREEGRKEGREEGREGHLITQVCRKLRKGKTAEQIADELEEDALRVKVICDVAEEFAPEYDEEKVMAAVSAGMFV
ncbi:MAG: hypothetical protein K6G19_12780 [Lachnospiraceae bacterium]|nr:hypothetical protein [Lachnospiraceae bacterium]